jgi:hypothetical protein
MVDKLKRAAANAAVNGFGGTEFHDGNPLRSARAFSRFPNRDALPGKIA